MLTTWLMSCCERAMYANEPFCPTCQRQLNEYRRERDEASLYTQQHSGGRLGVPARAQGKVCALFPSEEPILRSAIVAKNPARRAVFKLLGIYLPEAQARLVLQEIHNYKWITAEKAGKDVWAEQAPQAPFTAAARAWASHYLNAWLEWVRRSGGYGRECCS
jgi:hypothetical protein